MTESEEIGRLIRLLARLPGLGPRSARRAALFLMERPDALFRPLADAMTQAAAAVRRCGQCGNLDTSDPCTICCDSDRDQSRLCVVAGVADVWAFERTRAFHGLYHVLGGTLNVLGSVRPEDLAMTSLLNRLQIGRITEVILALDATVEGQATAYYVTERLAADNGDVLVTQLAHGVPMGSELDYLDDGTLTTALNARGRRLIGTG